MCIINIYIHHIISPTALLRVRGLWSIWQLFSIYLSINSFALHLLPIKDLCLWQIETPKTRCHSLMIRWQVSCHASFAFLSEIWTLAEPLTEERKNHFKEKPINQKYIMSTVNGNFHLKCLEMLQNALELVRLNEMANFLMLCILVIY